MKTLSQIFSFICLCFLATGCVIDAPTLPNDENPPTTCGIDESTCASGQICAVVDPCGSACPDAGPEDPCPQICIEVLGCVTPLTEAETCDPYANHCGAGLDCQIDESAGCGPTDCHEDGCLECPPIFTCQRTATPPATCDELDCGPGFRCEIVLHEGCGYTDPDVQEACEGGPGQSAVCVPEPSIDECDPEGANTCGWNEVCALDWNQCIPSHCDGEECTADCQIPFTCQPVSCENTECPAGTRCEELQVDHLCAEDVDCGPSNWIEVACVPENDHIIGETCEETECLPGFGCVEANVLLPCDGPGCEEPVGAHVSCEPIGDPQPGPSPEPPLEPYPADECDSDWDCGEGFECRVDEETDCRPSFCEGGFCTQDCVAVFTCQPIEAPAPPPPPAEPGIECSPDADACEAGLTCQIDDDAPCEPSFCDENVCTSDCRVVYTCQPE